MLRSRLKVAALSMWGMAAIGLIVLAIPTPRTMLPIANLAKPALITMPSVLASAELEALEEDVSPYTLARHFAMFQEPAPARVAPVKVAPTAPPAMAYAGELRFIGPVVVDGKSKWAIYDSRRQASFTIAPGESWADWSCVSLEGSNIIMRKNEKNYLVQFKK